jgi:hypothetical protein
VLQQGMTDLKMRQQAQDMANAVVRCELATIDGASMRFLDETPLSIEAAVTKLRQPESKSESPDASSQQIQTCKQIVRRIRETRPKTHTSATLMIHWPPVLVYEDETSSVVRHIVLDYVWYSLPLFVEPPFPAIWETGRKIHVLYAREVQNDQKVHKEDVIVDRQSFYSSLTEDEKLELIARPLGGRFAARRLNRALRESILRKFAAQTKSYQALTPEQRAAWNKMPTFGHRMTDVDTDTVREDIGL